MYLLFRYHNEKNQIVCLRWAVERWLLTGDSVRQKYVFLELIDGPSNLYPLAWKRRIHHIETIKAKF